LIRVDFNFIANLGILDSAVREWVGLFAYRITGRTDRLLPGDQNYCASA